MTTLRQASQRYTERSFKAFLEDQPNCTENWLRGVIRASSPEAVKEALYSLSSYNNERFEALRRACEIA